MWSDATPVSDTLKPKETWDIWDSTKCKAYMACPRRFLYEYVFGWKKEGKSIHLNFGAAFHEGMEVIIDNLGSSLSQKEVLDDAMHEFMKSYRSFYPSESEDALNDPKDPAHAEMAYNTYLARYSDERFRPLHTELPGQVTISKDHSIHFKIDSIVEALAGHNSYAGICSLEHKTASRNSSAWREGWHTALQPTVYAHALNCMYGEERDDGTVDLGNIGPVIINGLIIRKHDVGLERVPVVKNNDQMREWIWEIRYLFQMIDHDMGILMETKPDEPILRAFPKNTTACTDWGSPCPYIDFCMAGKNPVSIAESAPYGFEEFHWNPHKEHESVGDKELIIEDGKAEIRAKKTGPAVSEDVAGA